jgi:hypothetical protein
MLQMASDGLKPKDIVLGAQIDLRCGEIENDNVLQCSAVQCSAVQCSEVQCSEVQKIKHGAF